MWSRIKRILVAIGWPIVFLIKFILKSVKNIFVWVLNFGRLTWKKITGVRIKIELNVGAWAFITIGILALVWGIWRLGVEISSNLPNVEEIKYPPSLSSKIYDRNGILLYSFYSGENRSWIELKNIPKQMVWATLSIEDKEFYTHPGFSIRGIVRSIWLNLKQGGEGGNLRGGSTITQQLVKNVFLNGEKTWRRKFKELILAIIVERKLSKDQILERYFNQVPYGGEAYGIVEASKKYFGKEVGQLTLAQIAYLAGLPASPTAYLPTREGNADLAKARQIKVIEEMVQEGYLEPKEASEAMSEPLEIRNEKTLLKAPHFVFYVKDWLTEKMGIEHLDRQGLAITTSLDWELQKQVEAVVAEEVGKVTRLRISNGSALVLDVKTGDILAMVGSKDYYAKDIDGKVNITTSQRQPGSSIKPINYLLALQNGLTLQDTIEDSSVTYNVPGQKPYSPKNYNGKYMGRVTLKTALASSLNIPSVKLLDKNGVANMINLAENMGITTWDDRSRFGLSLALGAGEVRMTELAQAYSIFANLGEKVQVNPILNIKSYRGEVVYEKEVTKEFKVDPKLAYLIDMALTDDVARSPVFGLNSKLKIPGKTVAVKTGTTNNLKDNWAIGWNPKYLVAAWVGNNDGTPMSWVASGISGATPIWNRIVHLVLDKRAEETWPTPAGVGLVNKCGKTDWMVKGSENRVVCPPPVSPTPTPIPGQ